MNEELKALLRKHYHVILNYPTWNIDTKVGYIIAAGNIDPRLTSGIAAMPLDTAYNAVREFVVEYTAAVAA